MRRLILALLFLPLASAVHLEGVEITFEAPLLAEADLDSGPWQWAVLFLPPGVPATANGSADNRVTAETHVQESVWMDVEYGARTRVPVRETVEASSFPPGPFKATATDGWTSLVIEASDLRVEATDARARIDIHDGSHPVGPFGTRQPAMSSIRPIHLEERNAGPVLMVEPRDNLPTVQVHTVQVHLTASRIRFAEWHGWSLSCPGACGNAETDSSEQQAGPVTTRPETHRYVAWNGALSLDVQASAWLVVAGTTGPVTLAHSGVLRLPSAASDAFNATGEALRLDGVGTLLDLQAAPDGPGRFAGTLQGNYEGIRLGESQVDIRSRAAQVAVVAAFALVPFLLRWLWLLARNGHLTESQQDVVDALRVAPGSSFQDLKRLTGSSNGALDWSLRVLERRRLIASREYKNTKRFFWGAVPLDWKHAVVRGREELRPLLQWAASHPIFNQTDAVEALKSSRSTVQGWLADLLDAGILCSRKDGRSRVYEYQTHPTEINMTNSAHYAAIVAQ